MNPQSGAEPGAMPDHVEGSPAEPSAEGGDAAVPVEQFIWDGADAVIESAAANGDPLDELEVSVETRGDEAATRVVIVSEEDDEGETPDSWRRQLISALRDADRDVSSTKARPSEPPPIPPVEIPRRPPIAFVASRSTRAPAPPVERRPRHRMTPVLFGISAAAGLLTIAVPRVANTPETAAQAAASSAQIVTGSLVPAAGDDTLKPIIVNSPVLIRESLSMPRGPQPSLPVGPVIETVRTVPVQIGAPSPSGPQTSETARAIEPPVIPLTLPEATPAPPLDRERLAALIYDEPAAPPEPSAAAIPPPARASVEPAEKTTTARAETHKPAKARSPQVSSAYQRSIRETPRSKSASKKRTPTKTASRSSDKAKWETRRQGLRTSGSTEVKEVEPSTMVKLLKSLNPFASKEEPQARPKKNIFE